MFKSRLFSGVIMVIILLLLGITGGIVLWAGLGIVSIIGLYELYRVLKIEKTALGRIGYIAAVIYYVILLLQRWEIRIDGMLLVMAFMIVLMAVYVFAYPKYHASQVIAAFFGVFYVAVMLSCVYTTRMLENGNYLMWLIFICSWGCDTCAYCVGMLFGKHKMAPVLSPKKSIEGAVGGVVGAALLTIIYGMIVKEYMGIDTRQVLILAVISAVGALISMVGDLAASAIKRNYDIKDYGKLIPGHGGIMDRFDSVIFTAPIIYFLAYYFV